jgi:hypothetical protein
VEADGDSRLQNFRAVERGSQYCTTALRSSSNVPQYVLFLQLFLCTCTSLIEGCTKFEVRLAWRMFSIDGIATSIDLLMGNGQDRGTHQSKTLSAVPT